MHVAFKATEGGDRLILLGLTRAEMRLLKTGHDLGISAASNPSFPLDLAIVLTFGDTDAAAAAAVRALMQHPALTAPTPGGSSAVS